MSKVPSLKGTNLTVQKRSENVAAATRFNQTVLEQMAGPTIVSLRKAIRVKIA